MKEQTLICYRLKSKEEVLSALEKFKHTDIVLVLGTKIEKLFFINNMWKNWKECIIKVIDINDLLAGEIDNMKFNHEIGNPPYQKIVGPDKTEQIWPELVLKFKSLLKDGGDYHMIHPGNWKTSKKKLFKAVREMYLSHKITSMEFNDYKKGKITFGVDTDYDVISMVNRLSTDTVNITIDSETVPVVLSEYTVIPTSNIKLFDALRAKDNEEKVQSVYSSSIYETRQSYMMEKKDKVFKYPCVYGYPEKGLKLFYSNTNNTGHFGVSKLILIRASSNSILDLKGEYGLTQFAHAIIDTPENLIKIQKVVETEYFRSWKDSFCGLGGSINKNAILDAQGNMFKFIKEFRKDWWKEFYTEEMEQELIAEGKIDG